MKLLVALLAGLVLCACAVTPTKLSGLTTPTAAVQAARQNANGGAQGTFILTVNAVGVTRTHTFLDSAANYRARNNLAIAMRPKVATQVAARLNTPLSRMKGRRIVVSGIAKRVPIYLMRDGKLSQVQYYQTWVRITSPAQVGFAR